MSDDDPPAWTRVASTAFTASRGGLAPSTLALLNYNGLDSRAKPLAVAVKAANGNPSAGAPARKICGGKAGKILVSHTGGPVAKNKIRCDDYGPSKAVPVTGPVLTHGAPGHVRILTQFEGRPQLMGGRIGVYPSMPCPSPSQPAPAPCIAMMPCGGGVAPPQFMQPAMQQPAMQPAIVHHHHHHAPSAYVQTHSIFDQRRMWYDGVVR